MSNPAPDPIVLRGGGGDVQCVAFAVVHGARCLLAGCVPVPAPSSRPPPPRPPDPRPPDPRRPASHQPPPLARAQGQQRRRRRLGPHPPAPALAPLRAPPERRRPRRRRGASPSIGVVRPDVPPPDPGPGRVGEVLRVPRGVAEGHAALPRDPAWVLETGAYHFCRFALLLHPPREEEDARESSSPGSIPAPGPGSGSLAALAVPGEDASRVDVFEFERDPDDPRGGSIVDRAPAFRRAFRAESEEEQLSSSRDDETDDASECGGAPECDAVAARDVHGASVRPAAIRARSRGAPRGVRGRDRRGVGVGSGRRTRRGDERRRPSNDLRTDSDGPGPGPRPVGGVRLVRREYGARPCGGRGARGGRSPPSTRTRTARGSSPRAPTASPSGTRSSGWSHRRGSSRRIRGVETDSHVGVVCTFPRRAPRAPSTEAPAFRAPRRGVAGVADVAIRGDGRIVALAGGRAHQGEGASKGGREEEGHHGKGGGGGAKDAGGNSRRWGCTRTSWRASRSTTARAGSRSRPGRGTGPSRSGHLPARAEGRGAGAGRAEPRGAGRRP